MKIKKNRQDAVSLFEKLIGQLATVLPKRTQPFFLSLICGELLTIAGGESIPWPLRLN